MKSFILSFVALFIYSFGSAQNKDIEVFEKKEGDKILVIARNTGKVDYNVKVKITSTGMDVSPSDMLEAIIPAGFMKEMATITPRPAESWSYGFEVSYTQTLVKTKAIAPTNPNPPTPPSTPKETAASPAVNAQKTATPDPSLSDAAIVLYSKPGCSRCVAAKKQLTSLGIEFLEVNTQSESPEVNNMWAQLRNSGFTGGSVTMPVIRVNGKYNWNIQDVNGFVSKLKA